MFYFAYAGHNIPPKRIEFGKIQKNPPGPNGGGTRITISGKTPEEKAVWQTLGEGNEDCVEWVVLCAALNLLDDEIIKAAERNPPPPAPMGNGRAHARWPQPRPRPWGPSRTRLPARPWPNPTAAARPSPAQWSSRTHARRRPPPQGYPAPPRQYAPGQGGPPPQGYAPNPEPAAPRHVAWAGCKLLCGASASAATTAGGPSATLLIPPACFSVPLGPCARAQPPLQPAAALNRCL
ncbi:hypothetical protein EVG20_g2594 [Dentipellis fragilis]|uniref:Uncharacterized protein n=1 Tax=Dentipellis fragilis TaxID=205917 RepID=A0A4Y9Z8F2_9AGAM|nr:hypothetical protein EVG20_g2594 [Dentipellis fragilis]